MDFIETAPEGKPVTDARERLPNRRACETIAFEHGGADTTELDLPDPARAEVLEISSASIAPAAGRSGLLELDPRPCGLCGMTIDRHQMVDNGEGPEFFCDDLSPDDMTLPELERRAELRRQEDIAAILAVMDESPPIVPADKPPTPYQPAASTVQAFRLVVGAGDVARIKSWLADRPKDAPALLAMLESPGSC